MSYQHLLHAVDDPSPRLAIMGSPGSPETDRIDAMRHREGLNAALKWRTEQFATV